MPHVTGIYTKEEAHLLAQPNCPHCGLPLNWGPSGRYQHVKWFVEHGECGSKWCPDIVGERGFTERSKACEHIAALRAEAERLKSAPITIPSFPMDIRDIHGDQLHGMSLTMYQRGWGHLASLVRRIAPDQRVVDAREFSLLSQHWQLWEKTDGDAATDATEQSRLDVVFALTELYKKRNALRAQKKDRP